MSHPRQRVRCPPHAGRLRANSSEPQNFIAGGMSYRPKRAQKHRHRRGSGTQACFPRGSGVDVSIRSSCRFGPPPSELRGPNSPDICSVPSCCPGGGPRALFLFCSSRMLIEGATRTSYQADRGCILVSFLSFFFFISCLAVFLQTAPDRQGASHDREPVELQKDLAASTLGGVPSANSLRLPTMLQTPCPGLRGPGQPAVQLRTWRRYPPSGRPLLYPRSSLSNPPTQWSFHWQIASWSGLLRFGS